MQDGRLPSRKRPLPDSARTVLKTDLGTAFGFSLPRMDRIKKAARKGGLFRFRLGLFFKGLLDRVGHPCDRHQRAGDLVEELVGVLLLRQRL